MSVPLRYTHEINAVHTEPIIGTLGGVLCEPDGVPFRLHGTVTPARAGYQFGIPGLQSRDTLDCVLPGRYAPIRVSDRVWLSEDDLDGEAPWECVAVKRYTRHTHCLLSRV